MADSRNWFEVDRKGLGKLLERRGNGGNGIVGAKAAVVFELISNGCDPDGVTQVDVKLVPEDGVPKVWVTVTDDAPDGFADLRHAWTLFAESNRKADATKRGRFNLGEKLVLALCEEASIVTTTGGVMFDHRGRTTTRTRRERGSEFTGLARVTRSELTEILLDLNKLIPPIGVVITVNDERIQPRTPIATFEATLPTEISDEDGMLKRSSRKTTINVYETLADETAMLYEMGIPVVNTSDKWHVEVLQKIPLNMNRDNVTPAYLKDIRTLVVNHMHDQLDEADANTAMVNEALSDPDATKEAVDKALDLKYSKDRALFDQKDPEANANILARGGRIIYPSQLTKAQHDNVRRYESARPAGVILPTQHALFGPGGKNSWVPKEKWTSAMRKVVGYSSELGQRLLDRHISVDILSDVTEGYGACYGNQGLVFNLGRLGKAFFDDCATGATDALNQLLIHEFSHEIESNHLSDKYHEASCKLGAKLARLALDNPRFFKW
jgi:hypothetical protein